MMAGSTSLQLKAGETDFPAAWSHNLSITTDAAPEWVPR
jgi:hypothetical protein